MPLIEHSILLCDQMITAIQSGNLLEYTKKFGGNWLGSENNNVALFCFDFVATVVHITLLDPLDLLFIMPVNNST